MKWHLSFHRLRALAAMMTALSAALLAVGFAQTARLDRVEKGMAAVAQKAFYETCELTEAMSVNLGKLTAAGDAGQMQRLLGEISRQAQGASGNLALLPMGEEAVSATLKFINQTGDFAAALSVKLAAGGAADEEDYRNMSGLARRSAEFSRGLAQLLARLERGEVSLDGADGGQSLYPLSSPASEYPTLLYDGPFSDGAQGSELKALAGMADVTVDGAQRRLERYFDNVTDVQLVGESEIPVPCYEFVFVSNGYPLSAGVTRQGGQVLYALCNSGVGDVRFTPQQLLDTARTFLLARGYGPVEMSYYSQSGGVLTVNYAAVQDGVVLYPDLIKLQLSMKDGCVVGVEAGNYLKNHVPRTLEAPAISEAEAVDRLAAGLTPLSVRLCLIPVNALEVLCYEVRATDGSSDFLVYIDALTGAGRELMQVVRSDSGTLVQ